MRHEPDAEADDRHEYEDVGEPEPWQEQLVGALGIGSILVLLWGGTLAVVSGYPMLTAFAAGAACGLGAAAWKLERSFISKAQTKSRLRDRDERIPDDRKRLTMDS